MSGFPLCPPPASPGPRGLPNPDLESSPGQAGPPGRSHAKGRRDPARCPPTSASTDPSPTAAWGRGLPPCPGSSPGSPGLPSHGNFPSWLLTPESRASARAARSWRCFRSRASRAAGVPRTGTEHRNVGNGVGPKTCPLRTALGRPHLK